MAEEGEEGDGCGVEVGVFDGRLFGGGGVVGCGEDVGCGLEVVG